MARLRRPATVPNAVAASSIGHLDQDSDEEDMCDGGQGGSIPVQKNKASGPGKIPVSRDGPDTPIFSKKQRRAGELIVDEGQDEYFSSP
jgi:hypothetical protein